MKINNRKIGDGNPCLFMAEIGGNYKNFKEAKILIDSAKRIGIEVIKFQTFEADTVTTKNNQFDMRFVGKINQYKLLKGIEPNEEAQKQLYKYSLNQGLISISAPSHIKDLKLISSLDPPAYKIGSDLACHIPLLKKVARFGKPIILSTGMCTLMEIRESIDAIKEEGNDQIAILHCVSDYPVEIIETNLKVIPRLKKIFKIPVGFSDHSVGPNLSIAAVALGANIIERHFCNKNTQRGSDYLLSSNEKEYKHIIQSSRQIEIAMGNGIKKPSNIEWERRKSNRVSIIVMKDVSAGETINKDMVDIRRPGIGILPKHFNNIIGQKANVNIRKETPLKWEMLE